MADWTEEQWRQAKAAWRQNAVDRGDFYDLLNGFKSAGLELRPIAPEPAGEVGDLVAALEFYRDDAWVAEWEGDEDGVTGCELVPSKALTKDCGERARTALAAYKQGGAPNHGR